MTTEERQAQWGQWVQDQAASGQSARAYCGDRGISLARFYRWRKRLGATTEECEGPRFVELNVTDQSLDAGIRLRVTDGSVEMILARNFDVRALQQALAALSG